jgi:hypothetical protein
MQKNFAARFTSVDFMENIAERDGNHGPFIAPEPRRRA